MGEPKNTMMITAGRRLAIRNSGDGWWVGYSPRNDNEYDEGDWGEWVDLAKQILEQDAQNPTVKEKEE